MRHWQLQEAKNKLSELVEDAKTEGPQVITKRGIETVVVLSYEEYMRLRVPKKKLVSILLDSPLRGSGIDLTRDTSPQRPTLEL